MSQTGAGSLGGTPGQVDITLTVTDPATAPPTITHPGVSGPPPQLPTTGAPVMAEIDVAMLAVVTGALVVRLTSGGMRELLALLPWGRGAAS